MVSPDAGPFIRQAAPANTKANRTPVFQIGS